MACFIEVRSDATFERFISAENVAHVTVRKDPKGLNAIVDIAFNGGAQLHLEREEAKQFLKGWREKPEQVHILR
jgi:hypothetical protein